MLQKHKGFNKFISKTIKNKKHGIKKNHNYLNQE